VKAISHANPTPRAKAASPQALLALVEKTLDDGQAEDVVVIDLRGKSSIADYMVVATGRSQRHASALAEHLREDLDKVCRPRVSIEGLAQADWVLIDAGDVIVHVFRPEVRGYYNLEKMWATALPEGAAEPTPPRDGTVPGVLSA
jgi:ribosome-associated protein